MSAIEKFNIFSEDFPRQLAKYICKGFNERTACYIAVNILSCVSIYFTIHCMYFIVSEVTDSGSHFKWQPLMNLEVQNMSQNIKCLL